jgi:hypothetical protein
MPAAWSSSKSARRTKSRSTARRNASVKRAVSCTGHDTKVPSGRKPPSVTSRCRCGCQFAREPCVCKHATMPTARSHYVSGVTRKNIVTHCPIRVPSVPSQSAYEMSNPPSIAPMPQDPHPRAIVGPQTSRLASRVGPVGARGRAVIVGLAPDVPHALEHSAMSSGVGF